jgi:adenine deaminase
MDKTDIIIIHGNVLDVKNGKTIRAAVGITGNRITAVDKNIPIPDDAEVIDATGMYVAPGFMDGHLHVESSMLNPVQFAVEAARRGTTGLFVDPHELANVFGKRAIELFISMAAVLPLDMFVGISSCVPATHLEDSGATITADDVKELVKRQRVYGLAEMMNFPGIIHGLGDAREKVEIVINAGKIVDGHCPGLVGNDLVKYISNGKEDGEVRIGSDHEILSLAEALEKLKAGMRVMLREGSATHNVEMLLPGLLAAGVDMERVMLVSDDVSVGDLLSRGHMNFTLDKAIKIFRDKLGLPLEEAAARAIALATRNTANYFRKPELGEVAAGRRANLVVLSSLEPIKVEHVIHGGRVVVRNGSFVGEAPEYDFSEFQHAMNVGREITADDFKIPATGEIAKVRAIGVLKDSIATESAVVELKIENNSINPDPENDVLKIAVIERHHATGSKAVGFVKGLGIREGALASTVAHDSHNIIAVGANDAEMADAVSKLIGQGGGMVAVGKGETARLVLDLGGLMSTAPADEVAADYASVKAMGRRLGSDLPNVFMTMSFLALPVIPALKITNRGLVDVGEFDFVDIII